MDRVDYQSLVIQDLLNDYEDSKLDLNPWYQRRSVWTSAQQSYLINTLFERKPIPAIYIRHSVDMDKRISIKEVVDGQQRCRSIIDYCQDLFPARLPESNKRQHFSDLSKKDKERFLITPLPVGFLLGASDSDVIDIFARMNSVAKTLNQQEKRNAKFSGEYKQFCVRISSQHINFWRNAKIFTSTQIARMDEVQFISDLAMNFIKGLSDFSQPPLTKFYSEFEDNFPLADEVEMRIHRIFDLFYDVRPEAFSETIFARSPMLFSLMHYLDTLTKLPTPKSLENRLYKVDAIHDDDDIQTKAVLEFRASLSASTQRITSRRKRHQFLADNF